LHKVSLFEVALKLAGGGRSLLLRSTAANVGILAAGQYLAAGIGLATAIVASRVLGPEGYGQAALVMSFPSLLLSLGSFKSVSIATRYNSMFRATRNTELLKASSKLGYAVDFGASVGVFLIVLLTGPWVTSWVYGIDWLFWPMVAYAFSHLFVAFRGTSLAILSAFQEFRLLSILFALDKGISFFAVICLLWAGYGVYGLVLGMAIGNMLGGLTALGMAWLLLQRNGVGPWWKASLRDLDHLRGELFAFFGWNYVMTTLSGAVAQAPVMLLGVIRGPEDAGFFRLALALTVGASYPVGAAGQVLYSRLSARMGNQGIACELTASSRRWIIRAGLPMSVAIASSALLLPWLLPLVLGEGYRRMVAGAQMLLFAAAVDAPFFWLYPYYYASGRISVWTKAFAVYAGFILVLGSLAALQWGFAGMTATFGSKVIFNAFIWRETRTRKERNNKAADASARRRSET
jgi:O-antigen/teichoic acid export membrane protein